MFFRYSVRTLCRSPWFTSACIGTIALAVALASAVFAVVDGVLFKPLPYPDADRVALLFREITDPVRREQMRQGTGRAGTLFSAGDFHEWRTGAPDLSFAAFVSNFGVGPVAMAGVSAETTWAARVSRSFFEVMGVQPLAGGFREEHYQRPYEPRKLNAHPALVSHRLWRRLVLAGFELRDLLRVGDGTLEVVGVLPADFVFPSAFARTAPDVVLPLELTADQRGLSGVVRIPPGSPIDVAQARLRGAVLEPAAAALGRTERPIFRQTFAAVLVVVLLASLNVSALLAGRARDRAGELTIRTALGASRARLLQLMLVDAMVLALAGAVVGLLAAKPLLNMAVAILPAGYLLLKPPQIDARVVAFALLTATSTLLVLSAWPVVRIARSSAAAGLRREYGATRTRGAWRLTLVAQSALGIVVVIIGTLFVAGFTTLWREDPGLDRQGTALVDITARAVPNASRHATLLDEALVVASRVPGVERVSALAGPFLRNAIAGSQFVSPNPSEALIVQDVPVASGLFETAGIRLLAGRFPNPDEIDSGGAVAVVSERVARAFWPGKEPLGQLLHSKSGAPVHIVGVVQDVRVVGLEERQSTAEIYFPMRLATARADRVLVIRSTGDARTTATRVAAAVVRERPELIVTRAQSVDAALAGTIRSRQLQSTLFGAFAVAALVLLGVGMFGAIAMNTAARSREIGIRMALGATRARVRRLVLEETMPPVLAGLSGGCLGAWWASTVVSSLIYRVSPTDPLLWAFGLGLVLATSGCAAILPALRASRIDPQSVLRGS